LQRVARVVLRRVVKRLWPLHMTGAGNVPPSGAAILCPNHLSFFDSVFMTMSFDRPVYFIGKADYLDSWKTRRFFPAMGMIPIDRDSGMRAMVALDAAADVLRQGALLCVFPEGTRSRDGLLHRGYPGAARLAMNAQCPIVPIGITGTDLIQPPGARLPRPGRPCSMSIGAAIEPSDGDTGRKLAARAMTDRLMQTIAGLSGQRYVASYSPRSTAAREGRPIITTEAPLPGAA
jgi:1-acyl-sn-glycerol-3-phosphate acyltransferase